MHHCQIAAPQGRRCYKPTVGLALRIHTRMLWPILDVFADGDVPPSTRHRRPATEDSLHLIACRPS